MLEGEMLKQHLLGIAEKIKAVEGSGFTEPSVTACAIIRNQYVNAVWDGMFANKPFPEGLKDSLRDQRLILPDKDTTSTRGSNNCYLIHFVAPIAAYNNRSKLLRAAINSFGIDPGIRTGNIQQQYPPELWSSFWYSIGGDYMTDFVFGTQDENEYRADLLGLRAARTLTKPRKNLRLSEMLEDAAANLALIEGTNYTHLSDFKTAQTFIKPVFGHLMMRWMTKHIGFLQNNALVPVEKAYLT